MGALHWFLLFFNLAVSQGLKCRADNDEQRQEDFQNVMRVCMNDRHNDYNQDDSYGSGDGRHKQHYNQRHTTRPNSYGHMQPNEEGAEDEEGGHVDWGHRGSISPNYRGRRSTRPRHMQLFKQFNQSVNSQSHLSQGTGSPLDSMEACTIHCIFKQMQMLNDDLRPDKGAIISMMTQRINDADLKDFIQDSIEECLDSIESAHQGGKCELSKNFALCIEEKGRMNCEDWDEDMSKSSTHKFSDFETKRGITNRPQTNRG